MIDLVAVYYSLESDDSLPKLPEGHRAISSVAALYTIVNHDYLKVAGGLTYSKLISTLKSSSYHDEIGKCEAKKVSPVRFSRRAGFRDQNTDGDDGFNLRGIVLLLHHAFINRETNQEGSTAEVQAEGSGRWV